MSRTWSDVHIDEDCTAIKGQHDNALFFNCIFKNLNGLTLKDCVLSQSQFITKDIREAMGLTLTLNCHSFTDVQLSEEVLDLFLILLAKTAGNDDKRKQLLEVVGLEKANHLIAILKRIE